MKTNKQKSTNSSLDPSLSFEDEKKLRTENYNLYSEILELEEKGEDPEIIELKRKLWMKKTQQYMEKYSFFCDDEKYEEVMKEENKRNRRKLTPLKFMLSSIAVISLVLFGTVQLYQENIALEQLADELVVWEYTEGESYESPFMADVVNGYLIEKDGFKSGKQAGEDFKVLEQDTRVPDLDSVDNVDLKTVTRHFSWTAIDGKTTLSISPSVFQEYYDLYRSCTRYYNSSNFYHYITDEFNGSYVKELSHSIRSMCEGLGYSDWETVMEVINFVQNIPYVSDIESTGVDEWPKYVIETLYDECGDCEDKSFLLTGMLNELGYGAVLVVFDTHMGVGIAANSNISGQHFDYDGTSYYYIETTSPGWNLGELPKEVTGKQYALVEM